MDNQVKTAPVEDLLMAQDASRPTVRRGPLHAGNDEGPLTEESRRLREAERLLSVSRRVAAVDTLEGVLQTLVEMAVGETGAERGSLFLNDEQSGELYSRIAQGNLNREIRVLNTSGIIGHVFTNGQGLIVHDAYKDSRFNSAIDLKTGYRTRNILCAPVRTVRGRTIGVIQMLNKVRGNFVEGDLRILEDMTTQAAVALESTQLVEQMKKARKQEMEFLGVVSDITAEIELNHLLQKVMGECTRMLHAERSTLFLNNPKTNELYTEVGEGLNAVQIRFPNHLGIAGAVFQKSESVNIPYAYADLRFNPAFDKKTGFFTRSILCVPVITKDGKTIGVTQCLNKRGGPFTAEDETRLRAFTAQVSIALENARLFDDVQNMKNYNESMLESMSNGVITLDEDGKIVTCNSAGLRILRVTPETITSKPAREFFGTANAWLLDRIAKVQGTQQTDIFMDASYRLDEKESASVNVTVLPLKSLKGKSLGTMIMIEDISNEKRIKSTMARYMNPSIADKLLTEGQDILGGQSVHATVLFSDIRSFTTLTEELGAQGTVSLLNEYFSIMVDCIQAEDGMLDKFIGDAMMAVFGIPLAHGDDEDRAVRAAVAMMRELNAFNARRASQGMLSIDMGIGLNSDSIVSGNIGSPKRMDYTVIGDGVNLASRLESACKQYAAKILISEFTYGKLKGTYRTREVDKVVVKGKTEPVGIFEVLDYHSEETFPNMREALGHFGDGLSLYRGQHWDKASKAFEAAINASPEDKLASIYVERCKLLKANPPGDLWDGTWVMKSK